MPKKEATTSAHSAHMALDAAMDELVKQTDALLQQSEMKKPAKKPQLPKKAVASKKPEKNSESSKEKKLEGKSAKIIPHTAGAHLDIVGHAPSSPKKAQSKKTAHADLGYNESPADGAVSPDVSKKESKFTTSIIHPHAAKRLSAVPAEAAQEEGASASVDGHESSPEVGGHKVAHIKVDDIDVPEEVTVAHDVKPAKAAQEEVEQEEATTKSESELELKSKAAKTKDADEQSEQSRVIDTKTVLPDEPDEKTDDETDVEVDKTDDADDAATKDASEDGIVKMKDADKEEKTAYDVAEYQAQLHDWSKLSSNSHWSIAVLLFLLVAAGALMYLYFTNQLPNFF